MPMPELRPRLNTLVVATDFSASAALASERALRLPLAEGATVHLVHVVPERIPDRVRGSVVTEAKEQLGKAAATLEQVARSSDTSIQVAWEILEGKPHVELVREARRRKAELIVMGRHGEQSFKERLIGSTTERVVRTSELPSLIVNAKELNAYRSPLVAVDLTDEIPIVQALVDLSLKLVAPEVVCVPLLHVFQAPFERRLRSVLHDEEFDEYRREYKKAASQELTRIQGGIEARDVAIDTALVSGDPRQVIVGEAERRGADLLVLGTHGRTGIAHAFLGSVAEWVIRHASCDVAVMRPQGFQYEAP